MHSKRLISFYVLSLLFSSAPHRVKHLACFVFGSFARWSKFSLLRELGTAAGSIIPLVGDEALTSSQSGKALRRE